ERRFDRYRNQDRLPLFEPDAFVQVHRVGKRNRHDTNEYDQTENYRPFPHVASPPIRRALSAVCFIEGAPFLFLPEHPTKRLLAFCGLPIDNVLQILYDFYSCNDGLLDSAV